MLTQAQVCQCNGCVQCYDHIIETNSQYAVGGKVLLNKSSVQLDSIPFRYYFFTSNRKQIFFPGGIIPKSTTCHFLLDPQLKMGRYCIYNVIPNNGRIDIVLLPAPNFIIDTTLEKVTYLIGGQTFILLTDNGKTRPIHLIKTEKFEDIDIILQRVDKPVSSKTLFGNSYLHHRSNMLTANASVNHPTQAPPQIATTPMQPDSSFYELQLKSLRLKMNTDKRQDSYNEPFLLAVTLDDNWKLNYVINYMSDDTAFARNDFSEKRFDVSPLLYNYHNPNDFIAVVYAIFESQRVKSIKREESADAVLEKAQQCIDSICRIDSIYFKQSRSDSVQAGYEQYAIKTLSNIVSDIDRSWNNLWQVKLFQDTVLLKKKLVEVKNKTLPLFYLPDTARTAGNTKLEVTLDVLIYSGEMWK